MKCPYCGADNNDVTDTRARNDRVYRRRSCASCGMGFTTYEVYVPDDAEIHSRVGGDIQRRNIFFTRPCRGSASRS